MTANDIKYFYKGATFGFQHDEEDFLDRLIYELKDTLKLWYDVHEDEDAWLPEFQSRGRELREIIGRILIGLNEAKTAEEKIYIIDRAFNSMHSNGSMLDHIVNPEYGVSGNVLSRQEKSSLKDMLDLLSKVDLPRLYFHGVEADVVKLVRLADRLDRKGMYKEANDIDDILKEIEDKIEREDELEREEEQLTEEEIAANQVHEVLVSAIYRVLTIPRRRLLFETLDLEGRKAIVPSVAQEVMDQLDERERKVLSYDAIVDSVRYVLCVLGLKDVEELEELEERRMMGTEED